MSCVKRIRVLEDELHEYHMRERITSLVRYSETSPEMVMQRLLGSQAPLLLTSTPRATRRSPKES